jgi:hypothetical protein
MVRLRFMYPLDETQPYLVTGSLCEGAVIGMTAALIKSNLRTGVAVAAIAGAALSPISIALAPVVH